MRKSEKRLSVLRCRQMALPLKKLPTNPVVYAHHIEDQILQIFVILKYLNIKGNYYTVVASKTLRMTEVKFS